MNCKFFLFIKIPDVSSHKQMGQTLWGDFEKDNQQLIDKT